MKLNYKNPMGIFLLLAGLLIGSESYADLYMEFTIKTRILDKDGNPHSPTSSEQWVWAGKNNVRSETRDVISIMDLEAGLLTIITPAAQSYMQMPIGASFAALGVGDGIQIKITDLNQSKQMNKYQASAYEQSMSSPLGDVTTIVWATEDIKIEHPELLAKASLAALGMLQGADSAALEKMKQEMSKIKGVPIVSISSMKMGEETQQTMTSLVSVTEEDAPATAYAIPEGYSKMEMPGMDDLVMAEPALEQSTQNLQGAVTETIQVPAHDIPMTEISDVDLGYRIRVPEGFQTLRKGNYAHTFTKLIGNGHEYNVNLVPLGASDLDDAIANATMIGGNKLAETRDLGDGFWVVKEKRGTLQEIWVFRNGSSKSMHAKCTGPASDIAVLIDMCASMQVVE